MDEKIEKSYTLKSVKSEITRIEKSREKKREKIRQLTEEIKADGSRLKELESIYDSLYHEDLQRQIAAAWFKGNKLTGEQITKFLELSTQISDKIDILDVDTLVKAVTTAYNEQQSTANTEETPHSEQISADKTAEHSYSYQTSTATVAPYERKVGGINGENT